jgi:tripartite-type tricarboxylate transporter receptor subunit TctC
MVPALPRSDTFMSSLIFRHVQALVAAVAFGLPALACDAIAQDTYPGRPVKLVVPYPPGALTDLLARAIAEKLGTALRQPVVVENKPGAGTLVGAELVAKQPADGYTLLMATSTTLGISPALYRPSPIDPVHDFAPVSPVGTVNWQAWQGIVAPAGTPKEVVARLSAELQKIQATPEFKEPGQVRHGTVCAADARAIRRDDRRRAAALGQGNQRLRREGGLGPVKGH